MPAARKLHPVRFAVRGNGEFPLDMLRYDCCRAATPEDQAKVDWTYEMDVPEGTGLLYTRTVQLIADAPHGRWRPTEARWNSFSWRIAE